VRIAEVTSDSINTSAFSQLLTLAFELIMEAKSENETVGKLGMGYRRAIPKRSLL